MAEAGEAWDALSPGIPPWDNDRVRAICRQAIQRYWGDFKRWQSQVGRDDLLQMCMERCRKAHPNYDPARSQYITYMNTAASRALIDELRRLGRRSVGEQEYWNQEQREQFKTIDDPGAARSAGAQLLDWMSVGEDAGLPGGAGGNAEAVEDWLKQVYQQAKRIFPKPTRPCWYTPAQAFCLWLLMRRRSLSTRGMVFMLEHNAALRRSIELERVPDQSTLVRLMRDASENFQAILRG